MKKLKINLKNAYGIPKLIKEFDFEKSKSFIIYAPNGVMKTSFAKTFWDFSQKNDETKDQIYPENETLVEILVDEQKMNSEIILNIRPYEDLEFFEKKMSNLLLNETEKKDYQNIKE